MRQIAQSPEFDSRTMQPKASRYMDCAIPAHRYSHLSKKFKRTAASANFLGISKEDARILMERSAQRGGFVTAGIKHHLGPLQIAS
jgi:hypothetical protein